MIKDDFNVSWYEVSATNTSLFDRFVVLSQSARLIACSHRCRLFFETDEILQESWKTWLQNWCDFHSPQRNK